MKEIYKEIPGFPNYRVSNLGNVKNIKRDKIKEPGVDNHGYLKVDLYANSKRSTRKIHRLVADAFIPQDPQRTDINHKDGNKHNNNAANLERCTKSENMKHAFKNGLVEHTNSYSMLGKKNPNAGLPKRKVMIVETGQVFNSESDCERFLGGKKASHVNDCLRGRQQSFMGYHFKYV